MIEIPISGLLAVIGTIGLVASIMWIVYVNVELKHRGELADYNTDKTGEELREIKKRLHALESRKK